MIRELSPEHIHLSAGDHIKLTHCCAKRMGGRNGAAPPPPREHTLIGSPDFMAPEVILHKPYCEDADWWSYGVVLSELLAGYSPFYQEEPEIGDLLKKVLHYPIAIPVPTSHANPQPALDLIGELLIREVDDGRLGGRRADGSASGYTAVLAHPYFDGLTREEVLSGLPSGEGELFRHAQGRSYVENHEGLQEAPPDRGAIVCVDGARLLWAARRPLRLRRKPNRTARARGPYDPDLGGPVRF